MQNSRNRAALGQRGKVNIAFRVCIFCLLEWALLGASFTTAEERYTTVTGEVTDSEGNPLTGANIYLRGRYEGATSDMEGNFGFKTSATGDQILVVSFIGFKVHEKPLHLLPGETIPLAVQLQPTVLETDGVVVQASSFTSGEEKGVTLTSLEVVTTPGAAADVCRAIKTYPGVQQVEEGDGLFVTGGEVTETEFILDGALVTHPYRYESPTGGYFGTFSPFLLKGTYFSSGGFSAIYGNALSGVLAMESRGLPKRYSFNFGIGLAALSAMVELPLIEDGLGFCFSGNRSNTTAMFELNGAAKEFTRYPYSHDLNVNVVCKHSKTGRVKLFLFREVDRVGVEVCDPVYRGAFTGDTDNSLYNLHFSELVGGNLGIEGNLAYSSFKTKQSLNALDTERKDHLYQSRIVCEHWPQDWMCLRYGAQHLREDVSVQGRVPEEEDDLSPHAPTQEVDTDRRSMISSAFLEMSLHARDRLVLIPGLRVDRQSPGKTTTLEPHFAASFNLDESICLRAATGVYHQYPEPRYYDMNRGNPDLGPMSALHYVGGAEYNKSGATVRVEAYYKGYDRLLIKDEVLNWVNEGYGYAKGVDVFVKKALGRLSGWTSYNYLIARRKEAEFTQLTPPDFDITHNLTAVLKLSLPRRFHLGSRFTWATGKPYTPYFGQHNSARVPDYSKWDADLSWLHSFFPGNSTVFYLGISNLLNRVNIFDYRYSSDYSQRIPVTSSLGRSVYFGLSLGL